MDGVPVGSSLIKHLASCNQSTREKALKLLKTWLPNQSQVSDDNMKKIWKGLFYCVWHADKLPVQTELIGRLSSLLVSLDLPVSIHYFSVFLLTMRREWYGIDGLRLDKFYLLIRKFMHNFFQLMKKNSWDLELSRRLMGVLEERTFFADDELQGNGVNYHIASVFLEELKPFLPLRSETLDILLKPFFSVMLKSHDKVCLGKIKSNILDVLLKTGKSLLNAKKSGDDVDSRDDLMLFGTIALTMGFSTKLYDLGSSPECVQGNRKVVFELQQAFSKLEKDLACSGIELSISAVDEVENDHVPCLIPIPANEGEAVGSRASNKAAKKERSDGSVKKAKKEVSDGSGKKAKKEGSDGSGKKSKKKKAKCSPVSVVNENVTVASNGETNDGEESDGNLINFNGSVISNLQMQFEKVAAEVGGLDNDGTSALDLPETLVNDSVSRKRKRGKNKAVAEKSAKKVSFSMKNNLVWKPQCPLPPQSLRIPPSVTPRGSALKKGIPPGPVMEMIPMIKKAKVAKKGRKGIKSISPATKRLKKLKTLSI